jgi:hypothetical protein
MRRKQPRTLNHLPLFVIVEPILTRLEGGNDWMPRCRGMLRSMLTRRAVAASDVPALGTPAEMKPPTFRRRQAFHTPIAAWPRSGVDSALISLHFNISSLSNVTFSVSQLPGQWTLNSAPCVRASHSRLVFFQRQPDFAIGRWYWRCRGFAGAWYRVRTTLLAMYPIRTLVSVDTFVQ